MLMHGVAEHRAHVKCNRMCKLYQQALERDSRATETSRVPFRFFQLPLVPKYNDTPIIRTQNFAS